MANRLIRIEIVDPLGNKSYLTGPGDWRLMTSGRIALSLANVCANAALFQFALEDAGDDPTECLKAAKAHLYQGHRASVL